MMKFLKSVWELYRDGFREMTVGRYLWAMIIIKVIVIFFIFGLLLLPNRLNRDYDNDTDRAQAVRSHLIAPQTN